MKKLLLLLFVFISLNAFSQIKVKEGSFHRIDGYLMLDKDDHRDIDWKPMALIKLTTENMNAEQRARLRFKGNLETQIDVELAEIGETHLYISAQAATFLEIIHPDYGKTEFTFPMDLCDFCGYEMVIEYTPKITEPQFGFLAISSEPSDADIYIDGKKACGILCESKLLPNNSLDYIIVGIGINLCEPRGGFPEEISEIASSLFGSSLPNEDVTSMICAEIINLITEYSNTLSDRTFIEEYRKRMYTRT